MIDETVKALAQGKNFAAFTTLFADGRPQTQVMWIDADDDFLLINTETHRAKYKNTENDPRVTVTIMDATNPYHYAEVRGRVAEFVRGDAAFAHINKVSNKYTGGDYANPIQSERVVLQIVPEQVHIQ
jgi:PPOX class probable F420-dependent enzyme